MLVTSEINMSSKDIYNAYHQLWQIEESFRIMKSEFDTRPVYHTKRKSDQRAFLHLLHSRVIITNPSIQDSGK